MDDPWVRGAIAIGVILLTILLAKIVDSRISRPTWRPTSRPATAYCAARSSCRSCSSACSALLVIPRPCRGRSDPCLSAVLASCRLGSAAALGNFIAGTRSRSQPIRLGDEVQIGGTDGVVEESGSPTRGCGPRQRHARDPERKLASDSVLNRTIRSADAGEVKVDVPLTADIRAIVSALEHDGAEVYVTELGATATVSVRRQVASGRSLDREESELRVTVHERLGQLGALPVGE
jgi:hypothetical protein